MLVVPRSHVETLTELDATAIGPLFAFVQRIARGVERGMSADGSLIAINNRVSQSVPHLHVHVIPRTKKDGFHGFFWPRRPYASAEEARSVGDAIRAALEPSVTPAEPSATDRDPDARLTRP